MLTMMVLTSPRCDDGRVRFRLGRVLGAAVVCCAVAAAVAYGLSRSSSRLLSSDQAFVTEAQVAAGSDGDAVAVWNQQVGEGGSTLVVSSRNSVSGGWSRAHTLYGTSNATTFDPEVVMDPSGAAVIVWQPESNSPRQEIDGVMRASASAPWTAPARITYGTLPGTRELSIDDHGNALLAYTTGSSRSQRVDAVSVDARTGRWGTPAVLGRSTSQLSDPTVAEDAGGQAVAAWSTSRGRVRGDEGDYRYNSWVEATVRRAGLWAAPQRLGRETQFIYDASSDATLNGPEVAVDARGSGIAIWQHSPARRRLIIDAATVRAGTTRWKGLRPPVAREAIAPQVASSPSGWVTLAWETGKSGIATKSGPILGCCWSHTRAFPASKAGADFDLHLVAGPGHAAALAFARSSRRAALGIQSPHGRRWRKLVQVGYKPGRRLSDPIPLSLAVGTGGELLALWTQERPSSSPGLLASPLHETTADER